MDRKKLPFDPHYYARMAESIHDCGHDQSRTTTKVYNKLTSRLFDYLKRFDPLPPSNIEFLISLLTHPKRGVRVQAAADLLTRGYVQGWPVILEAAYPSYIPDEDEPVDVWRDFCANQSARRFIMGLYKSIEHLSLAPSLEETEARWRQETPFRTPIPILDMVLNPNIPIRS